jgi:hypothetical protein
MRLSCFAEHARVATAVFALTLTACSSSDKSKQGNTPAGSATQVVVTPGDTRCPATGVWAECAVMYRLTRSGLAPRIDSTAKAEETALHGKSIVMKIGVMARLEVFLYPDSASRVADGLKLDRTQFVNATGTQTIRRERTLIENGNMIALLTSLNERQRERVSDALNAGAPQPNSRQ